MDMVVAGEYKVTFPDDIARSDKSKFKVSMTNPLKKPNFLSSGDNAGTFTFTTDKAGVHDICFMNNNAVRGATRVCILTQYLLLPPCNLGRVL